MEILILDEASEERIAVASFSDVPQIGSQIVVGNVIHRYGTSLEFLNIKVKQVVTFSWNCMNARDGIGSMEAKFRIENHNWGQTLDSKPIPRYRLPQVLVIGEIVSCSTEFSNTSDKEVSLDYIIGKLSDEGLTHYRG